MLKQFWVRYGKSRSSALKICLSEFFLKPTALVMSFRRPMYREWRFRRKRVKKKFMERGYFVRFWSLFEKSWLSKYEQVLATTYKMKSQCKWHEIIYFESYVEKNISLWKFQNVKFFIHEIFTSSSRMKITIKYE